jgi:hypothetical protein
MIGWAGGGTPLVETAEFDDVQGAYDDDERQDRQDSIYSHDRSDPLINPGPSSARPSASLGRRFSGGEAGGQGAAPLPRINAVH